MERGLQEPEGETALEQESEQRRRGIAKLAFQLLCNDLLDEALAGRRTIKQAGAAIEAFRPMIFGEEA